jgi:hypothetical protein
LPRDSRDRGVGQRKAAIRTRQRQRGGESKALEKSSSGNSRLVGVGELAAGDLACDDLAEQAAV